MDLSAQAWDFAFIAARAAQVSAFGGKADSLAHLSECLLTAVKRKSVNGPEPNKADNLRTRLNHDRQSQFSVVSGPGFEPAIERQGSDNWGKRPGVARRSGVDGLW
jgi:hypothetical protein